VCCRQCGRPCPHRKKISISKVFDEVMPATPLWAGHSDAEVFAIRLGEKAAENKSHKNMKDTTKQLCI
jgi:hypothetical protein